MRPGLLASFAATASGLALVAPVTVAQTSPDATGSTVSAFFESSLEANDNYDLREDSLGNALIWTNTVGAALIQQTRTDLFAIEAQGSYRFADLPEVDDYNQFDDPRLNLRFAREGDDDLIAFSAAFRRVDEAFFDPLSDVDPDGNFDNSTDGTRESADLRFDLLLNDDGPVSLDLNALYSARRFIDSDDPDQNDRELGEIGAELGFRLTPLLTATVGAAYDFRDYTDDTLNDRQRTTVDVGLDARINPRMTGYVRIGYSEVDIEGDGTSDQDNGAVGRIGFVADTRTGDVRAEASSELTENGTRNRLSFGQLIDFRSGNTLNYSLGVTNSDETDLRPIATVEYTYRNPRSVLQARFRQDARIDDESRNVLTSLLGLEYQRSIDRLSQVSLGLDAGLTRYENDDREDSERATLTASYGRALTRDWGVDVGYRHQWRSTDTVDDAQSNSVFLTLRRDWSAPR